MRQVLLSTFAVVVLAGAAATYAHHSDEATYRVKDSIQIEGTVSQVQIRNPHSWIFIDVVDPKTGEARWGGEWRAATQLARDGVNANTLKVGEKVVVKGAPSRNSRDTKLLVRTLTRVSDGKTWGEGAGGGE